jgi:hypothetical protein
MQYITGIHGNERVPVVALASIGVPQIVANERALAINQRFIDTDMNRSFGRDGHCYEIDRAREVLESLTDEPLIDFHTMSADSEPFSIVVDKKMIPLAKTLGLPVVYMKRNIKKGYSLINHHDGVSVEAGIHDTQEAYDMTKLIHRRAEFGAEIDVDVYEVYDKIIEPGVYKNFVEQDGFYPVLAGERAYDFFGLKAKKVYGVVGNTKVSKTFVPGSSPGRPAKGVI